MVHSVDTDTSSKYRDISQQEVNPLLVVSPLWNVETLAPVGLRLETQFNPARLTWDRAFPYHRKKYDGCLENFVRLAKAPTDEALLIFANEWGVLNLCKKCGKPESHALCQGDRSVIDSGNSESLEDWRTYIRQAHAMYHQMADLHDGNLDAAQKWESELEAIRIHPLPLIARDETPFRLTPLGPDFQPPKDGSEQRHQCRQRFKEEFTDVPYTQIETWFREEGQVDIPYEETDWLYDNQHRVECEEFARYWFTKEVEFRQKLLRSYLNQWMGPRYLNLTPVIQGTYQEGPHISLAPDSTLMPRKEGLQTVFSVLTLQLAACFTGRTGIFRCSECQEPFSLGAEEDRRKVKRGRRGFCSDFCKEEARKRSKRESWHKNKGEWRKKPIAKTMES